MTHKFVNNFTFLRGKKISPYLWPLWLSIDFEPCDLEWLTTPGRSLICKRVRGWPLPHSVAMRITELRIRTVGWTACLRGGRAEAGIRQAFIECLPVQGIRSGLPHWASGPRWQYRPFSSNHRHTQTQQWQVPWKERTMHCQTCADGSEASQSPSSSHYTGSTGVKAKTLG